MHEIKSKNNLLDSTGNIAEPGWSRHMHQTYDRNQIKKSNFKIKEWDYYLVTNGKIGVALTIADNGYMGLDSISFLDFKHYWEITKSPMRIMPLGKTGLPTSSNQGSSKISGKNYSLVFNVSQDNVQDLNSPIKRTLKFHMDNFKDKDNISGKITLTNEPDESIVIATPFDKPGHFYFNQKINCMRASGKVKLGQQTYTFNTKDSFATLDWGRGVWTYHNTWYWGSASGTVDSIPFGWNIGYGFGNTSAASENCLFYNGKIHKLDQIKFHIPDNEKSFMKPWKFTSNDGRFEMDFIPVLDRAACTDFKILKSDQHQVFGHFTGTAILDDGTKIHVKDFFGFAEKVENKW